MQVGTRKTENRLDNGWFKAIILVIGWLLIISLARDVWQIKGGFGRIDEANKRLEAETEKNQELKEKLNLVMTDTYKEKLIREKLNMQKEGEVIVVFPGKEAKTASPDGQITTEQEANWEKWWGLVE